MVRCMVPNGGKDDTKDSDEGVARYDVDHVRGVFGVERDDQDDVEKNRENKIAKSDIEE
jgi:hypothetical protein